MSYNCCPNSDAVKYDIHFYLNKKNKDGNPVELVQYTNNISLPDLKIGDKIYISQGIFSPRVEKEIRDSLKNQKIGDSTFSCPDNIIDELIPEMKEFNREHSIYLLKITSIHRSIKNEWIDGKFHLIYTIEYKVKEYFSLIERLKKSFLWA